MNKKVSIIAVVSLCGFMLLFAPQQVAMSKQEFLPSMHEPGFLVDPYAPTAQAGVPSTFILKKIEIEGNRLITSRELQGLTKRFLQVDLSYKELIEIKASLENHYTKQNLVVTALLPPQDMKDGVLKVELIESAMTDMELERAVRKVRLQTPAPR